LPLGEPKNIKWGLKCDRRTRTEQIAIQNGMLVTTKNQFKKLHESWRVYQKEERGDTR